MNDPGDYARRVRAHPYGPREVIAGSVTAWFHGPFAVLTVTGTDGTAVTVRATSADDNGDDVSIGVDLAALFTAASRGRAADLPRPDRLVCEQPLTPSEADETHVRGLTVRPAPGAALVTVTLSDRLTHSSRTVGAALSGHDTDLLASATRTWASATTPPSS